MTETKKSAAKLDKPLFFSSMGFTAAMVAYAAIFPQSAKTISRALFTWVTHDAGFIVLISGFASLVFLLWLALGRFGKIKLGDENTKPQFRFSTYVFMMFTAGVGSSLIYWAMGEPMYYLSAPPMFEEPGTAKSTMWLITYPLFHWGPTSWAIYTMPGVAFAYYLWNKKKTNLRLSNIMSDVIGEKNANGPLGTVLNILAVFGVMCGVATGMGFGADLIASGLNQIFGIPNVFTTQLLIVFTFVAFFTVVVVVGLQKGVARVSDINTYMALLLAVFVLLASSTSFIINFATDSIGVMLQNYIRMSFWTDPVQKSGFPQDWTAYYWAWYFAYLLMMGLFVGKISKGRTIKELILTGVICGSCGCAFFTSIFGGFAVNAQLTETVPLVTLMNDIGTSQAIITLIKSLPLGLLVLGIFLLVEFLLMSTTMISSVYALSLMSSKNMAYDAEPDNSVKIVWAFAVGGMSLVSMLMGGSVDSIKSMCVVAGFPLIFVMGLLMYCLLKWLRQDLPTAHQTPEGRLIVKPVDAEKIEA